MVALTNHFETGTVKEKITANNEIELTFEGISKEEIDKMFDQSIIPISVNLWDILI